MSVRAIPVPEIDEEGGLSAIASWLDDWNVYLGRSKHYHAYGVPPADIPETFPAVARVGDADLAATIARFADETGCANETRLRQANITLYCDLQYSVRGFPLLSKTVKAARSYKQAMIDVEQLHRGHRSTHVSTLRASVKECFSSVSSQHDLRLAVVKANEINRDLVLLRVPAVLGADPELADYTSNELREMLVAALALPGVDLEAEHRQARCDSADTRFNTYDKLCSFVSNLAANAPAAQLQSALPASARTAAADKVTCFKCGKVFPAASFGAHLQSCRVCKQPCTVPGCSNPSTHLTRLHADWAAFSARGRGRGRGRGAGRGRGRNGAAKAQQQQTGAAPAPAPAPSSSFLPFGCAAVQGGGVPSAHSANGAATAIPAGVTPRALDSMCSQHLVSQQIADRFAISRRPVQPGEFDAFTVVGGRTAAPSEVAVIPVGLPTCDLNLVDTGVSTVVLSSCLVVPGVSEDEFLISYGQLQQALPGFGFCRSALSNKLDDLCRFTVNDVNGTERTFYTQLLWGRNSSYLRTVPVPDETVPYLRDFTAAAAPARPTRTVTPIIAHKIFFHLNKKSLKRLQDNSAGLRIVGDINKLDDPPDEACLAGKMKKTGGLQRSADPTQKSVGSMWDFSLTDVVHIDWHGNYKAGIDGATGYYSFSTKGVCKNIPCKSIADLLPAFRHFRLKHGKPAVVQFDRQSNAVATSPATYTAFELMCNAEGIMLRTSTPGNAEEHGMAEKAGGRDVYEHVTAACEDVGIPASTFFGYGVAYYSKVANCIPLERLDNKTRFEHTYGVKLGTSHLHRFGAPALVLKSKKARGANKSWKSRVYRGIYLGAPDDQKAGSAFIYNIETKRVITTRDVYINDTMSLVTKSADGSGWNWLMDDFDKLRLEQYFSDEATSVRDWVYDAESPAAPAASVPADAPIVPPAEPVAVGVGGVPPTPQGVPPPDETNLPSPSIPVTFNVPHSSPRFARVLDPSPRFARALDPSSSTLLSMRGARDARDSALPVTFVQDNPKRAGTESHRLYEHYKSATTPAEFFALHPEQNRAAADWRHDVDARHVTEAPSPAPITPHADAARTELEASFGSFRDEDLFQSTLAGSPFDVPRAPFRPSSRCASFPMRACIATFDLASHLGFPSTANSARVSDEQDVVSTGDVVGTWSDHFSPSWRTSIPPDGPVSGPPRPCPTGHESLDALDPSDFPEPDWTSMGADFIRHASEAGIDAAKRSTMDEMKGIASHGVLSVPVELPVGYNALPSKLIHKVKPPDALHPEGRAKSRFVPGGHRAQAGSDYLPSELPAPTADRISQRLVDLVVVQFSLILHLLDVCFAFLHGDLPSWKHYYVFAPRGWSLGRGPNGRPLVWKLLKSCYGIPEAPQIFYRNLVAFLRSLSYVCTRDDPCLFYHRTSRDMRFISVHVDDSKLAFESDDSLQTFKRLIRQRYGDVSDLGEINICLGLEYRYNSDEAVMVITCERFIVSMLKRFGMWDSHPVSTPMSDDVESISAPTIEGAELQYYLEGVGCIQWIASTLVRPDLAITARVLGSARTRATTWHLQALKRALRYCKGSISLGVRLARSTDSFRLTLRCDSNWAACKFTRKSTTGLHATIAGMPLATVCKHQATVALASTHAETIAMSETCRRIMAWRRLLSDIGFPQVGPTTLYCDNQAAIAISENQLQLAELSRHLATRHLYVRELVGRGFVHPIFIPSKKNAADFVTKALPPSPFLLLRGVVMGHTTCDEIP